MGNLKYHACEVWQLQPGCYCFILPTDVGLGAVGVILGWGWWTRSPGPPSEHTSISQSCAHYAATGCCVRGYLSSPCCLPCVTSTPLPVCISG